MNDIERQRLINRAAAAERILSDEVFVDAMQKSRDAIVRRLEEVDTDSRTGMRLMDMLQAHKAFRRVLQQALEDGDVAENMLRERSAFNRSGL